MDRLPSSSGPDGATNNPWTKLPFYDKYVELQRKANENRHKKHLRFRSGSILITDGATPTGRQIATILNKKGHYRIHALYPPGYFPPNVPPTERKRLAYPVDKMHFLKPVSRYENYVSWYDAVVEICHKHNIHYIIPQHDTMAVFAARIRELRRRGICVHTPRLTSIHSIVDKLAMYRMLRDLGIWHHPWVSLGKETNSQHAIMQTAGYIEDSGNYPVMLTDRTEGSDSVYVRIRSKKQLEDYILEDERKSATEFGIFNNGKLEKWHGWTLLPVQQETTSHFRKTSAHNQTAVLVLQKIGMHLNWHGGLSVTFWLPIDETEAEPRVMRIDMGIHEPMNAYYSRVDLIDALLDLRLPENSGTEWEDGSRWQDPDHAFDMPQNLTKEDAPADVTRKGKTSVGQNDVEEDDDSKHFPLRVILMPDFDPPTRWRGVQVQATADVNSSSASRLSRELTVVASSDGDSSPEDKINSWRTFHTLRTYLGVEGYGGDGPEETDLAIFEAALPNGGRCKWKTGVATRQFVLESEQRITASEEKSMLKRLATVLGDTTWRKSKEEHTPLFLNPWTTSIRNMHNVAKQVIDLSVKGKPGPTLLSTLLRDDWPRPNPRGLRRDQYAKIFKTHLWDGPEMPDGPWGLALPVESHYHAKRFRVHSQKGVPSRNVAYQFFVRQGRAYNTGTLLPLGHVSPNDPNNEVFCTPVMLHPTPFDLICVGEEPETWNSWTFVPDPYRPREGVLIPSHDLPKTKHIVIPDDRQPWGMTPGRCFFYRGSRRHVPRQNRPYRYRMDDNLRYMVHDRKRKLPNPPKDFYFVDDTLPPPVSLKDSFQPIVPLVRGIPRTDIAYFYHHATHYSRPYMGIFVPADHRELVQKQAYNFYRPTLLEPVPESPPTSSSVKKGAFRGAQRNSRDGSESADQSPQLDSEGDTEERGTPTEPEQEQDPKNG
ncbi:uncharacterized protein B0T23DRAFT_437505 [Neurospora hispaniola]|uniref:Uncharacterized protein n=1 Tax=Neurospora hispaniola TaxID=588809 RepID=A0AAJ0IBM8_9PEZI|nr:hypothetical protein B0T23DRAFT_437505 [Neurospora hispaniola]